MRFASVSRRYNSSFIKNVMEQVKKEVDTDPKMKQAWEEFAAKKKNTENTFQGFGGFAKLKSDSPFTKLKESRVLEETIGKASAGWSKVSAAAQPLASKVGQSVQFKETISRISDSQVLHKVRSAAGAMNSRISKITNKIGGDSSDSRVPSSYERWRQTRDATVQAEEATKAREEAIEKAAAEGEEAVKRAAESHPGPTEPGDGLVVSDRGNSTWERFGANMRDMPFLNGLFSNPLMESLFGETEISASIRQMREDIDPSFRLDEFVYEIESIVTPNFIKWYLEGEVAKLKEHCGEAAFAAVNASISARNKQKLYLDTNLLSGPSEFELKAAKAGSAGESAAGVASPLFVFTFNTQQINCLRDADGHVVEGAVDDIRQLFYAIAIQRSPKANTAKVDFPWQIQEIAILGNQPCW
jgi:import inner membrane translocase subunit TIM44